MAPKPCLDPTLGPPRSTLAWTGCPVKSGREAPLAPGPSFRTLLKRNGALGVLCDRQILVKLTGKYCR